MSRTRRNITLDITQCCIQDERRDSDRKHIARRRWGILAKALKSPISSQPSSPTDEISMRRFSSYMLLTAELLQDQLTPISIDTKPLQNGKRKAIPYKKRNWYRYSAQIGTNTFYVDIGHILRSFTAADLMGFNNTGNVCVWPSEEALAYYVLNNLDIFKGKCVLELGAGMSALAGLMVAKYGQARLVNLTDGNDIAVDNVKLSLARNSFDCVIHSEVFQWGTPAKRDFDVILSADCLFFDEARNDLIETIWESLAGDGLALVMAPKRGDTLEIFHSAAQMRGFECRKLVVYNEDVWTRHLQCLDNPEYEEDIHYPILLLLTKSAQV
ncbi:uncharacterized protein CBL_09795 [Carabus blaptoides fortunei]